MFYNDIERTLLIVFNHDFTWFKNKLFDKICARIFVNVIYILHNEWNLHCFKTERYWVLVFLYFHPSSIWFRAKFFKMKKSLELDRNSVEKNNSIEAFCFASRSGNINFHIIKSKYFLNIYTAYYIPY